MHSNPTRATMLALFLTATTLTNLQAQNTESFEGITAVGTVRPTVFVNAGQSFTITTGNCFTGGTFGVFIPNHAFAPCNGGLNNTDLNVSTYGVGTSCTAGNCTGTSAKFIDDGGGTGLGQIYSIKTTNAALFTIKSLYVFPSSDNAATPSDAGGVTFRGKIAGNVVFTYNKTSGFNTGYGLNNGFTFVDFASVSFANTNIDELEMQTGASANYFAVDNFTWGISVPLPVTLTSFTAQSSPQAVLLNWSAARENRFSHYELEHSSDGKSFTTITTQQTNAGLSAYHYTDHNYVAGKNYYRLRMVDQDGAATYSSVASVEMDATGQPVKVFPNPATDKLFIVLSQQDASAVFQLIDMTGRLVKVERITGKASLNISDLPNGVYQYRVITDRGIMQQGKISCN